MKGEFISIRNGCIPNKLQFTPNLQPTTSRDNAALSCRRFHSRRSVPKLQKIYPVSSLHTLKEALASTAAVVDLKFKYVSINLNKPQIHNSLQWVIVDVGILNEGRLCKFEFPCCTLAVVFHHGGGAGTEAFHHLPCGNCLHPLGHTRAKCIRG